MKTARKQRRDQGSGSISQRQSDGRWVIRLELPPHQDGRRRRKITTAKTKVAAVARLRELQRDLDIAGDLTTSSPTVAEYLKGWMERKSRDDLKPRTAQTYESTIKQNIVPAIGRYHLDKLTPIHVRQMQDFILGQGKSPTTALSAYRILAKALADALRDGRVTRNVAAVADAPKRAISKRGALTATQARQLLTSNSSDLSNAARLSIALLAGLRQGEKLGLTADMIDLKRGIITVAWQLQSLKANVQIPPHHEAIQITNSLWLTRPKSRAGWREVPMAPQLQQILAHYLERFPPNKHGLIFHNNGNPIPPAKDGRDWKQALSNANLEHVPLHSARHTTATLLHSLGVPDLVRISILGHSSSTVTAGYTHVTTEEAIEAMNKLGRLIES